MLAGTHRLMFRFLAMFWLTLPQSCAGFSKTTLSGGVKYIQIYVARIYKNLPAAPDSRLLIRTLKHN